MKIDASAFNINNRPREYEAVFEIEGELRVSIEAASPEEASNKAKQMLDEGDFGLELDEVTHAKVYRIRKRPPMFLVTREGRAMQVSVLELGDEPREPDERGF
jgi:hypothetical protein